MVVALESLQNLNAEQLRELIPELIAKIAQQSGSRLLVVRESLYAAIAMIAMTDAPTV